MIKNDPYQLLKKEGINKGLLADKSKEGLSIYDETIEGLKDFPNDKALKDMAEKIGKATIEVLEEDIKNINSILEDDVKKAETKKKKKAISKRVIEKSSKTKDHLAECREKFKKERQRQLAAGEIKAPVKKQLATKLKEAMKKIVGMMPKAIKEDEKKIAKTELAITHFISDLKRIWGMNKIKPIEDELKEKFDQLKENAA